MTSSDRPSDPSHDPGGTVPGGDAPTPGADAPAGPAGPPPKKGLSTGAKVAIGCGAVAALGLIAVVVLLVAGGLFVRDQAEDFTAGMERQAEAGETLDRLQREHPFEPPEDAVVGADRAERFFAVTDDAWAEMEEWAEEVESLSRREREGRTGIADMAAGLRGIGGLAESRAVLADALEEHDMSLGEYVWTGLTLLRAHGPEATSDEPGQGAPPENVALAREYADRLDELEDEADQGADRSVVLALATVWGMSEPSAWQALGLDTLQTGN